MRCALRWGGSSPGTPRLLEEMPAPDLPPAVQLVEVSPPVMAPPGTSGRGRITVGVDYLERQAGNRDVGLKGERLVIDYERARLAAARGISTQAAASPSANMLAWMPISAVPPKKVAAAPAPRPQPQLCPVGSMLLAGWSADISIA